MPDSFRPEDIEKIRKRGASPEELERQLALFRRPPEPVLLDRPATAGDGILRLDGSQDESLAARASRAAAEGRIARFVPASGAASRMFKALSTVLNAGLLTRDALRAKAASGDADAEEA